MKNLQEIHLYVVCRADAFDDSSLYEVCREGDQPCFSPDLQKKLEQ